MALPSRSAIAFGQFLNTVSRGVLEGAPLAATLDVIRAQFNACAAALHVERRGHPDEPTVLVIREHAGDVAAMRDVLEPSCDHDIEHEVLASRCHGMASCGTALDGAVRYTLWIYRDRAEPEFDAEEEAIAQILVTQVAHGLEVASRIDSNTFERTLYLDVLDKLNVGFVMIDQSCRVIRTSRLAERILSRRDGLLIQAGKLCAVNSLEDRELQKAIKAATQRTAVGDLESSRGLSFTKRSGSRTLGVMIRPVTSGVDKTISVVIYIRDCDMAPDVESEFVRQMFDLTPAEAAVTRGLAAGLSLEDAAISLDISRNTARAHLRSIFSKSGITRQTELVRLVLNSAVILGDQKSLETGKSSSGQTACPASQV
ncbi:helix-turn-helix transcriptional regulator [Bradyrhizobium sp. U87765 SZCCT0131]|uniref:helix-turn-helix transcriptional regulator n=1 Tax=unclassified Bradyrhizobium TaxID=2631580 RepID=UPI001BA750ED|nr:MULTISPECIES: helix-turn-helix transcriptional regulator [unclassified Bradyrhizobium]MBR1217993.1 helix-turn-helix transcriptional regulator [Bradyrhizobium sp. U87765 SZCCT0131]MBR1261061.1 helix-turn-helix transcriptional regulator [Bradyrhizobium sp. U87765 SZCCT0134]MBR1303491.1 helix-turn-helix transcriptional regulator [Bradyrhizobium sp. U87765 SZCCT0110]MBR1319097.1 helix-turn-helix transcriptional regulator [Bradyrhizobium sp. U87765 SZCCT0109]MBR1347422.1 helix-turn-helix transcr